MIFRIDAQHAIARWRRRDKARQLERDRQHKAEVVVGVLADQIDAAGRAVDVRFW